VIVGGCHGPIALFPSGKAVSPDPPLPGWSSGCWSVPQPIERLIEDRLARDMGRAAVDEIIVVARARSWMRSLLRLVAAAIGERATGSGRVGALGSLTA